MFADNLPIDRLSVTAQRIQTTVRLPLNAPTIVGGLTIPSPEIDLPSEAGVGGAVEEEETQQLYLIVEVSLNVKSAKRGK
jgi:hypothetical protein